MRFNTALQTLQNLSNAPVRPVDIAKALGVSRSNINYKKDKNVLLSEDDIRKIEEFFNIKMISPAQIPAEYTQAVKYVEKGVLRLGQASKLLNIINDEHINVLIEIYKIIGRIVAH